jgi:hypothetical protein
MRQTESGTNQWDSITPGDFQLPNSDNQFMAAVRTLEDCAGNSPNFCNRCPVFEQCLRAFNSVCDGCYDRRLKPIELGEFNRRFNDLHTQ